MTEVQLLEFESGIAELARIRDSWERSVNAARALAEAALRSGRLDPKARERVMGCYLWLQSLGVRKRPWWIRVLAWLRG